MNKQMFQTIASRLNLHAVRREGIRQADKNESAFVYSLTGYTVVGLAKYDSKLAALLSKVDGSVMELDTYIIGRM